MQASGPMKKRMLHQTAAAKASAFPNTSVLDGLSWKKCRSGGATTVAEEMRNTHVRGISLELQRLLHCMETNEAPDNITSQALLGRAHRCRALWQCLTTSTTTTKDESNHNSNDNNTLGMSNAQLSDLRKRVETACLRATEIAESKREEQDSSQQSGSVLNRLFPPCRKQTATTRTMTFARGEQVGASEPLPARGAVPLYSDMDTVPHLPGDNDNDDDNASLDESGASSSSLSHAAVPLLPGMGRKQQPSAEMPPPAAAATSLQDLQRAQREQMEEAIGNMASQLRAETAKMHTTLQSQTQGVLSEMEDLATTQVAEVTNVSRDVQQHVQKNWTRTVGTWTMIFATVGAFAFTLVTIYMAPKHVRTSPRPSLPLPPLPNVNWAGALQRVTDLMETWDWEQKTQQGKDILCKHVGLACPDIASIAELHEEIFGAQEAVSHGQAAQQTECELDMNGECVQKQEWSSDMMNRYHDNIAKESVDSFAAERSRASDTQEDTRGGDLDTGDFFSGRVPDKNKPAPGGDLDASDFFSGRIPEKNKPDPVAEEAPVHKAAARGGLDNDDLFAGRIPEEPKKDTAAKKKKPISVAKEALKVGTGGGGGLGDNAFSNKNVVFGGEAKAARDEVPVYNGRPFSARFVRKAATRGDVELLAGYLSVKPEWCHEPDKKGWTTLHFAAREGHTEALKVILTAPGCACVSCHKDSDGLTARDVAEQTFGSTNNRVVRVIDEFRED